MSEAKTFNCPSCGSKLSPQGDAAEIKCPYCGNTVIVPEELRTHSSRGDIIESTPVIPAGGFSLNASASAGSTSIVGMILGIVVLLVILGMVGVVLFGSLGNRLSLGPTAIPLPTTVPTPAGFARVVLTFGGQGTAPGLFQSARNLAVDINDNVYVDDHDTLRVQKFDPAGKYVSGWTVDQSLCTNKSATLDTLATDRAGNVYVHFCGAILKYDGTSGKLLAQFKGARNSTTNDFYTDQLLYPNGEILALADGAPEANEVLLHLDANGKVLARYPNLVSALTKNPADALTLLPAMDGLGNIFLLNIDESVVYKFTPDGKFVNKFGSVGSGVGQFDAVATHIAVDNQSRVYVTDFSGIKRFDVNGAYLDSLSDRSVKGITAIQLGAQNEIYVIGGQSQIFKLVPNKN